MAVMIIEVNVVTNAMLVTSVDSKVTAPRYSRGKLIASNHRGIWSSIVFVMDYPFSTYVIIQACIPRITNIAKQ